ncbi:hypothetical protein MKW92_036708 [Papaver armeniacum]|nr:hypothetical protein MKW92_036708 [Papaver armeniacum]
MERKPRFLCLHGMRTSAKIFKQQIFKKWPDSILENIDLVFIDAPFPSLDKPTIKGFAGISLLMIFILFFYGMYAWIHDNSFITFLSYFISLYLILSHFILFYLT